MAINSSTVLLSPQSERPSFEGDAGDVGRQEVLGRNVDYSELDGYFRKLAAYWIKEVRAAAKRQVVVKKNILVLLPGALFQEVLGSLYRW